MRHEDEFLETLRAEGLDVLSLESGGNPIPRAAETRGAMRAGREVIHQACFLHDGWVGYADFLVRIDDAVRPRRLVLRGPRRKARPTPEAELHLPAAVLHRAGRAHPGPAPQAHAPDPRRRRAAAVSTRGVRRLRRAGPQALPRCAATSSRRRNARLPVPRLATATSARYWGHCKDRRRDEDHLSLVALAVAPTGTARSRTHGVHSVAARRRAAVPSAKVPASRTADARRHCASRPTCRSAAAASTSRCTCCTTSPSHGRGLARLPKPSAGDVFFDFEGDPYWGDEGLEYLFGTVYRDDAGEWTYWPLWAHDRAGERAAFEQWMDWITERLARPPGPAHLPLQPLRADRR